MSTDYDVMISYQWDSQPRMLILKDKLKEAGLSVWMDVERMAGSMNDRMAEAVEGSKVILVCVSKKYQGSWNCKKEANYADAQKKRLIPLKYDDHKASGWLGLLIRSLLYYDVSTDKALDDNFDAIVRDIKTPPGAADVPTAGASSAKPKTTTSDSGRQKIDDKDIRDVTSRAKLEEDDLANLFTELDIEAPQIQCAKGAANTSNYQLQASNVLKSWRKKKGNAASRIAIIHALEECDLTEAVQILKRKWEL